MNYKTRIQKVSHLLTKSQCEALLIENTINLLYLTGLALSAGKLLVYANGEVNLLVDNRYFEMCRQQSALKVFLMEKMPLEDLLKDIKSLAFDSESTTYQNYLNLQKQLKGMALIPLNNPIQKIRAIKDPQELALLNEAAVVGKEGYAFTKSLLKDGITEIEIANELEIFWKKKGGQGLAFAPIIAFGKNSALPHHRAGDTPLRKGDTVLIDIGVKWKGYHSDLTRTSFWGEPSSQMQEIYTIVQEAQVRALDICKPGVSIEKLDAAARDYIASQGYGDYFLHSLGHGVGLEIHEWPLISSKEPYKNLFLEEGEVITIEPGIYLAGIGGVRIEDTITITDSGYKILG